MLDFVGTHRQEFRFDLRFRALLGGTRSDIARAVKDGFPVARQQRGARVAHTLDDVCVIPLAGAAADEMTERRERHGLPLSERLDE